MINNGFGSRVNVTFTNKEDKELYADVPLNLLLQADINDSFYKRGDIIYSFKTPLDDIIKGCAVNEALYIKINQYMPYIVYAILLFVLIVCCIIIVILSKIFNIHIHYLYILVNSIIIFVLVVTYAFFVLYFTLTQPYVLNIDEKAYLALYDFVNS